MEINEPRNYTYASICCERKAIVPPESGCYWNTSFLAKEMMFPDIYCSNELPNGYWFEKPDGIVSQYSEATYSELENDFFNLMKFGINRVNTSINDRLIQRLGAEDYNCSIALIIANGTKNVVSICGAWFDLDFSSMNESDYVATVSDSKNDKLYKDIMRGISLPFLAITFLIYTILPELRNLHGSILRSYTACSFIDYTLLIIPTIKCNPICSIVLAIFELFTGVATFFWLSVMCFDIWWTFRALQDSSKQEIRKRFINYSIYAWGVPTLMTGLFSYNAWGGWISDDVVFLFCLAMPVAGTLFFNLCFFILTVAKIIQHRKDTAQHLEGSKNQRHSDEKLRFIVYLKLFAVMGIAWVEEILVDFFNLPKYGWGNYILYILQLPSLLQGIFVFILFVCTSKIKRLLSKRVGCLSRRTTRES